VAQLEPGRKGEILGAAADVFAERGYDAGSMRDIASRVGVTEPALYRHYPGKEALFLALVRLASGRVRDESFALIDAAQPGALHAQLVVAFADRRQALTFYAPVLRTVLSAAAHNPTFLAEYRRMIVEPLCERLTAKAVELDAASGVPSAETTREARVRALMALLVGYFLSSMVLGDEPDEAIADAVLRVMEWESLG
jgi:AcrR family transcriptional regulator